jgi:phosphoribosylformimino-5-aminoimidazole carboxamide ribotide isomerase
MKFRPCIDLHGGKVKQIVGGSLGERTDDGLITNFESDRSPAWYASRYREDGLDGGHVIMLGEGNRHAAMQALSAFPGGLQAGGGMNPDTCGEYLDAGASHVIVTSYVFRNGVVDFDNLRRMRNVVGRDRLVLDLSCRKRDDSYYVVTDRWRKFTSMRLNRDAMGRLSRYCAELLVHAVDVEGKRAGFDETLVALLGEDPPAPVTYAGGVRTLDDLDAIDRIGRGRIDVTIGSALDLFGGTIPYRQVVAWHSSHNRS